MRSGIAITLLAGLLLAAPAFAETVSVVGIHATGPANGAKDYDTVAKRYRSLLERLPHSTFKTVKNGDEQLEIDGQTKIKINDRYTLYISATEVTRDGLVLATLRVMGTPKNSRATVKVVEMRARLARNKPVAIYGLRMSKGEVAVFVTLR